MNVVPRANQPVKNSAFVPRYCSERTERPETLVISNDYGGSFGFLRGVGDSPAVNPIGESRADADNPPTVFKKVRRSIMKLGTYFVSFHLPVKRYRQIFMLKFAF